ncbi:hypothetical protein C4564_06115 [Candidatus Microgenomates bacterium]|nr:MAG: hypothetical protein C4564_06115 [Candidatus Microgenomates bacterium]
MYSAMHSTTDKTIRKALIKQLDNTYDSNHATAIISEFSLSNTGTRADVAVINGILHGYELKGDLDTLARLPGQIDGYNAVFDKITIVVGKKHLLHTVQAIPDWWGVMLAKNISNNGEPLLIELRPPSQNIYQDIKTVVRLLWRNELVEILKKEMLYKNKASSTKDELINILISNINAIKVKNYVRQYLISRNQP